MYAGSMYVYKLNIAHQTCPVVSVLMSDGCSGRRDSNRSSLSTTGGSSTDEPTSKASLAIYSGDYIDDMWKVNTH